MKRFSGVLYLLVVGIQGSFGQGYQQVKGQVVDQSTGKPVEFACVSVSGKAWGTLANREGRFLLNYPKIDSQKEGIISAVGYQNAKLVLRNLKPIDSIVVSLEPVLRADLAVSFRRQTDGRLLVFSALKAIHANFQATPTVLTGFYRETLSTDTVCWTVREAILKVEKLPKIQTELPEKVKLVKGRQYVRNPLPKALEGYAFPNGAAIVTRSMDLGPPEYWDGDNLNDYEFRLDSVLTASDNRPAYRLAFAPVAGRRVRAARKGEVLIDTASRAIVRIAYEFTPEAAGEVLKTNLKAVFENLTGRSKKEVKRIYSHSHYRQLNGKWFLQDSRLVLETQFSVAANTPMMAVIALHFGTGEYARSNGQAVQETEVLTTTENLPKQTGKLDDRFWGNFNTILPTEAERLILPLPPKGERTRNHPE
ncbi:carboxypeptidase-like regulatory domain-containing protein [Larkinella humicola]|uniref:Carboxypeptidase-like regulatory domain-containing protein n=1 Tax=Larkinella humicola TaxID=2607654 RepID=A0A5N1J976_9BACT|nr:carboxypeptidase-like regulatory domain-containing protein [Larkinella humicola]KAA9349207.1 carboxypeptidase-like regulatory domain-containing protein [Larkinella humicola]